VGAAAAASAANSDGLELIKLLAAGVTAAVTTQVFTWYREHRRDKATDGRAASYSALRLASLFEEFAIACADAISDTNMSLSSEGHAGRLHTKLPILPPYPEDMDWRALDVSLAAKALAIRNELVIAQQGIDFWYDVDHECVPDACLNQLGVCGYRAWLIAAELRHQYKIPLFDPRQFGWDVEKCLKDRYDLAMKEKSKTE
jgi:hypothetical protein